MIRKAVPDDIPAIVELGIEALNQNPYPRMVISKERCFAIARECVSSAQCFAWVAEKNGRVDGALLSLVQPNMFYERQFATVIQFYTKIPGEGVALMREFLRWARKRPIIKLIVFTVEINRDPRVRKLLTRLGLREDLSVYIEVR